jgi:hypothetical protein
VSECDQAKINNLDTCCEQVGRRGRDCDEYVSAFPHVFKDIFYTTKVTAILVVQKISLQMAEKAETCSMH